MPSIISASVLGLSFAAQCLAAISISPDSSGRYNLWADGIKASFIPYGATMTNLFVKDKNGMDRDIVLGYDNTSYYPVDPAHPVYDAVPGRYAGRIGNHTFTLDNVTYITEANDGNNTLHSGTNNWSYRFWNVTAASNNSITFSIHDPAYSSKGMPGDVNANVTYTLESKKWRISMRANSPDMRTIIMLTQHTYFNLDAFSNPDTDLIWNHTIQLPHSPRYLDHDNGSVPTGKILTAAPGSLNDLASAPRQLGYSDTDPGWPTNCGPGCDGYNNQWLIDGAPIKDVAVRLSSNWTGIKAELHTNQAGIVVYTCNWMDGSIPIKSTQGVKGHEGNGTVKSGGCVAIEAQDWVDGIQYPEWGRLPYQVFGPNQTYEWEGVWEFGTLM